MTVLQWNSWAASAAIVTENVTTKVVNVVIDNSDEEYMLACVAENLGLAIAPPESVNE